MKLYTHFGTLETRISQALAAYDNDDVIKRLWERDHSLWSPEPDEISNRLGWLDSPTEMVDNIPEIMAFAEAIVASGFTHVLLLGMGGSSLAPDLFAASFPRPVGFPELSIVDSTHPDAILAFTRKLDPHSTFFIVATKSGGTVETLSLFKHFYNWTMNAVGMQNAGSHFAAITDPDSDLVALSKERRFRHTFLNNPDIGGRYSALSYFGLVPAALCGVDLERLLSNARSAVEKCGAGMKAPEVPAAVVGAFLAEAAIDGREKLTFQISSPLASFGDWTEQLIAESTGKDGKGILPVVGEADIPDTAWRDDQAVVIIRLENDSLLARSGGARNDVPSIEIVLKDAYEFGGLFFIWEMATAMAGRSLGIQPFNQPNVEAAKVLARELLQGSGGNEALATDISNLSELSPFLAQASSGDYVAIQAFLPPDEQIWEALVEFRKGVEEHTRVATTLGYGPRYLHSTGQLHKGDAGRGLFVQLVGRPSEDAAIPDKAGHTGSSFSFGELIHAQALGDAQALRRRGRRVFTLILDGNYPAKIMDLMNDW